MTSGLLTLGVHGLVIGLVLVQQSYGTAPKAQSSSLSVFSLPATPQQNSPAEPDPQTKQPAPPAPPPRAALAPILPELPLLQEPTPVAALSIKPINHAPAPIFPPATISPPTHSNNASTSTNSDAANKNQTSAASTNSAPSETSQNSSKEDAYARKVLAWIARHKEYPRQLARDGKEGTVIVRINLTMTGELENIGLANSSGHAELDRLALTQLRNAIPYPRAPRDASADARRFLVPMRYRISG